MPQVVIVGAGPIGLNLALRLLSKGVYAKEIVIVDPRAGHYTRPGALDGSVFYKAYQGLNLTHTPAKDKPGHIKEIEREQYQLLEKKGVRVLKERFIDVKAEDKAPAGKGVIISDGEKDRQIIPCNYVFDCTGPNRQVAKAVNAHCKSTQKKEPFRIQPYTHVQIKRHHLAYVKMADEHRKQFVKDTRKPKNRSALAYLQDIIKLQQFGWQHYDMPSVYAHDFGKGKVCIYTEIPDHCPKERESAWLKAVIDIISQDSVMRFEELKPSKRWGKKPRFQSFTVNPQYINTLGYEKSKEIPIVAIAGDAADEPNYILGHGIVGGTERNKEMLNSMETLEGEIAWFEVEQYDSAAEKPRRKHKEDIIAHYEARHQRLEDQLQWAKTEIETLLASGDSTLSQEELEKQLTHVNAQLDIISAVPMLKNYLSSGKIADGKAKEVLKLQGKLLTAVAALPSPHHKSEFAYLAVKPLIEAWKEWGNSQYKAGHYENAQKAYHYALAIINKLPQAEKEDTDEIQFILMSNRVQSLHHLGRYQDSYALGEKAQVFYQNHPMPRETVHNKIKYHMILNLIQLLKSPACSEPGKKAEKLHRLITKTNLPAKDHEKLLKEYQAIQSSLMPPAGSEEKQWDIDDLPLIPTSSYSKRKEESKATGSILAERGFLANCAKSEPHKLDARKDEAQKPSLSSENPQAGLK